MVVYEHLIAEDTPNKVVEKNEKLPTTTRDGAEDMYNSGVATRIVDVVGVYGATTLKCCSVLSNPIAGKILVGVSEHALAVRAVNSVLITDESKEKNTRTHGVDTDGSDHRLADHLGGAVPATGLEGCGTSCSACEKRDPTALSFTRGKTNLPNVLAVVGTSTHEVVLYRQKPGREKR